MVLFNLKKKVLQKKLGLTKKISKFRTKMAKQDAELQKIKDKIRRAKKLKLTPKQKQVLMKKQKMAMARKKEIKKNAKVISTRVLKGAKFLAKELQKLDAVQGSKPKKKRKKRR